MLIERNYSGVNGTPEGEMIGSNCDVEVERKRDSSEQEGTEALCGVKGADLGSTTSMYLPSPLAMFELSIFEMLLCGPNTYHSMKMRLSDT